MFTTYAMTLPTKKWTELSRNQAIAAMTKWHTTWFPHDRLPANIKVRIRHSPDDEVFRIEVHNTHPQTGATHLIIATLTPNKGQLVFDLRAKFAPGKEAILPHRRAELPPKPVRILVSEMAQLLEVYDAERRINPAIRNVSTALDGEALAADFINALARRLPILVETTIDKTSQSSLTGPLLEDLVGITHIAHITSITALEAFNKYCNAKVLDKNYVTILWPHPAQPLTFHTLAPSRELIETPLLEAAALQPDIPVQAPPRFLTTRPIQQVTPPSSPDLKNTEMTVALEKLARTLDEHQLHIEQLDDALEEAENERDEFAEMLEEKESETESLGAEVALLRGRLDAVTLQALDLEAELHRKSPGTIPRTVLEAVHKASQECLQLKFLRSAFETADTLQGPNPERLLNDFRKLNKAVTAWRSNMFSTAGLGSYLRDEYNLDFAANISEDSAQKYANYYTVIYEGAPVLLGAHLKRGKNQTLIRVYMHVDTASKLMIIGKIDRHGPDRTS